MKFIGILMISDEDDILERVIKEHEKIVDAFYVLDGSQPNDFSKEVCTRSKKCEGYLADSDVPHPPFPKKPSDGWRQILYSLACEDFGFDNWFVLLHGDEIWQEKPREIVGEEDGYVLKLPFYFPRQGEGWDYNTHPLDQLKWNLGPGFPEFRLFRGSENVYYLPQQHFNTRPMGISSVKVTNHQIKHYLYRSPKHQRARAARHVETGFDPDNYKHITKGNNVYWTDKMIREYQSLPYFQELNYG